MKSDLNWDWITDPSFQWENESPSIYLCILINLNKLILWQSAKGDMDKNVKNYTKSTKRDISSPGGSIVTYYI